MAGGGQGRQPRQLVAGADACREPRHAQVAGQARDGRRPVAGQDLDGETLIRQGRDRFARTGAKSIIEGEGGDELPVS
jgi:hypothetical protein